MNLHETQRLQKTSDEDLIVSVAFVLGAGHTDPLQAIQIVFILSATKEQSDQFRWELFDAPLSRRKGSLFPKD